MSKEVVTITEDATIEEAARIMSDSSIGGIPVVHDNKLVGIITESDLFHVFLEMLGARTAGVRVTVECLDEAGKLSQIATVISQLGGNIHGMGAIQGESTDTSTLTLKVAGVDLASLEKALQPLVIRICDIREEKGTV